MKKPDVYVFDDPVAFMREQLLYLKKTVNGYSVRKATTELRRCSPALISNILAGKRKITEDRIPEIARVLRLNTSEEDFLKSLVLGESVTPAIHEKTSQRKRGSSFLLNDWINPYVKDAIKLKSVRQNIRNLYGSLSTLASKQRIDKSLSFLLKNGYLCKNEKGEYVVANVVDVLGDRNADKKIRHFHKQSLELAKKGIDQYSIEERIAQALILTLDSDAEVDLKNLINEFADKLQSFSEKHAKADKRLYQLIIHLTPTGGQNE